MSPIRLLTEVKEPPYRISGWNVLIRPFEYVATVAPVLFTRRA